MATLKKNKAIQSDMYIIEDSDHIIGMPPKTYVSDELMRNSMPVAEIIPQEPSFKSGLTLFQLSKAWRGQGDKIGYLDLLEKYKYTINGNSLKVAFLADNFPTDTFNNEYGETFLDQFTNMGSGIMSDMSQMFGGRNMGQTLDKMAGAAEEGGGLLGMAAGAARGAAKSTKDKFEQMAAKGGDIGLLGQRLLHTTSRMMAGARVDFPQVWKNSRFTPSYTMTVRLYNPNPASDEATQKYIVGPLCALLLLGIPRSDDGDTYNWPFLHKITCPGVYNLNAAFISSIAVVKGGDQQSIAWNQRLGMCDVRIDFGSLYDSLLVDEKNDKKKNNNNLEKRPTLESYLDGVFGSKVVEQLPRTSIGGSYRVATDTKIDSIKEKNLAAAKNTSTSVGSFDTGIAPRWNLSDRSAERELTFGREFYNSSD